MATAAAGEQSSNVLMCVSLTIAQLERADEQP